MSKSDSLELQAFSSLYNRLLTGIKSSLHDVAFDAFSKNLISPSVKNVVVDHHNSQTKEIRADSLLEAVLERIQNIPSTYEDFAAVLEAIPSLDYLGEEMKNKRSQLIAERKTLNMKLESDVNHECVSWRDEELICQDAQRMEEVESDDECNGEDSGLIAPKYQEEIEMMPSNLKYSSAQKGKGRCICFSVCTTGLILILTALFSFGITSVIYGVRYFEGYKKCPYLYSFNPGAYTFLFGLMLIKGVIALALISIYVITTKCSNCCNKRNKVIVACLSVGIILGAIFVLLLVCESIYSLFVCWSFYSFETPPPYYTYYSYGFEEPVCKDVMHYITFSSILLLQIPIGLVIVGAAVIFIAFVVGIVVYIFRDFLECVIKL